MHNAECKRSESARSYCLAAAKHYDPSFASRARTRWLAPDAVKSAGRDAGKRQRSAAFAAVCREVTPGRRVIRGAALRALRRIENRVAVRPRLGCYVETTSNDRFAGCEPV